MLNNRRLHVAAISKEGIKIDNHRTMIVSESKLDSGMGNNNGNQNFQVQDAPVENNGIQGNTKTPPELVDSIDLSGLPILGSKESPIARRLFWSVFIIGGLIYTLYYIVDQVRIYF